MASSSGGYDEGYAACDCFWGTEPGSLVRQLVNLLTNVRGLRALDVGCGEGKNAAYLAALGATVSAFDISALAIEKARRLWPSTLPIEWAVADARCASLDPDSFDIVIAYGLLHCFVAEDQIFDVIRHIQNATRLRGYNVICAFNARYQDLGAHPGFKPTLLGHHEYLDAYVDWNVAFASDSDLTEVHPHNNIMHTHALTRLLAQRV